VVRVVHTLTGLGEPQGIAVAPAAKSVYVANAKDGACRVYDAASYRPLGSIDLKDDADNVRYDAGARRIYVGCGDGALAVIDAATRAPLANIKLPAHPESFQLETKGRRIFVNLPDADGTIAVVDRTTAKVIHTWRLDQAKANFPMALDEPGHRLFVACRRPARLLVIDTESGRTVDAADCVGDADDVWYDAPARRVYVSGGEGFVSVLALAADGGSSRRPGSPPPPAPAPPCSRPTPAPSSSPSPTAATTPPRSAPSQRVKFRERVGHRRKSLTTDGHGWARIGVQNPPDTASMLAGYTGGRPQKVGQIIPARPEPVEWVCPELEQGHSCPSLLCIRISGVEARSGRPAACRGVRPYARGTPPCAPTSVSCDASAVSEWMRRANPDAPPAMRLPPHQTFDIPNRSPPPYHPARS
jgi:hypothetical protein